MARFTEVTRHGRWIEEAGTAGVASVIIPTFNRAGLLDEAIGSVVRQTYRPIEIVVVDDGSTDQTGVTIGKWRELLGGAAGISLKYVRQENSGGCSARNHGLIESTGEFIQFMDSDDYLRPEKLRVQIGCLREFAEAGFAFGEQVEMEKPGDGELAGGGAGRLEEASEYFGRQDVLPPCGVYRRGVCVEAGPWAEDLWMGEDKEYGFRALLVSGKVVHLAGAHYVVRKHSGERITNVWALKKGLEMRLKDLERMAGVARRENCLGDRRLVAALALRYTWVVTDALRIGEKGAAREAVRGCTKLPLAAGRRARFWVYGAFCALPAGAYRKCAGGWESLRRFSKRSLEA
jgi:glycosyltransferase involved in cell wall biosynthesis